MNATGRSVTRLAALAAVAVALAACATVEQRLQRWEGRPIKDLVADRGPASRIVPYPYGGRLYIWESFTAESMPPDATGRRPSGLAGPIASRVRREIALVDDGGLIVRTHVESDTVRRSASRPS